MFFRSYRTAKSKVILAKEDEQSSFSALYAPMCGKRNSSGSARRCAEKLRFSEKSLKPSSGYAADLSLIRADPLGLLHSAARDQSRIKF